MPRPSKFDDSQILEAASQLQADGQAVTGYALSVKLGGGRPSSLAERYAELTANQEKPAELPALPSDLTQTIEKVAAEVTQRLTGAMTEAHATMKAQAHVRIDEIEAELANARKQHATELDDAADHLGAMQERAETAEAALATANADLKTQFETNHRLELAATRAEDALKAAQGREAALTEGLEKLRQEHLDATRQVGLQSSEIDALLTQNKALAAEKTEAVAQRDAANKQREEAQREAAAQGARVGQLQESEKRLQTELSGLNQTIGKQAAELAQLNADKQRLQAEAKTLQDKHSEQAKQLTAKDAEIAQLNHKRGA